MTRRAKGAEMHLGLIKQRWLEIRPLLEKEIDVGDVDSDGETHSDGILFTTVFYV